ncbi:MAG: TIGR02452 family protein [Methanobrevibacter sp.]|uniref:TIGR02452 family protein n=1 Tax=Methanobrevibacter sp. TaxID=66852 RepID=UPI0026E08B5A|nr:TIGR02452 family protein [Methanobrevibacter sp.]MDO5849434.1 TIGR02452 family protein [Methanobrevibacter sp.]
MSRHDNVKIFEDTINQCFINRKLREAIDNSIEKQKVIDYTFNDTPARYGRPAKTIISRKRTFEAASKYKNKHVGVLNFASYTNPGGGVFGGSRAQEEALCRCSTLYIPLKNTEKEYHEKHRQQIKDGEIDVLYGDDCIYTPDVVVFKSDTSNPQMLDENEWYKVDVISAAAPNLRKDPSNKYNPDSGNHQIEISDYGLFNIQKSRIRQIFSIAKETGIEVLIVGAFGCGAFKNPPKVVANAFKEVIEEFKNDFEVIEIAIAGTRDTRNLDTFRRVFN